MKKLLTVIFIAALFNFAAAAQNSVADSANPETVGNESAMQALKEISLDKFEREGSWMAHITPDFGVASARLFDGAPAMKDPLKEDEGKEDQDTKVLGVKIEFFKRGINSFFVMSQRPVPIEGTTKTISVWACGRNMDHQLVVLVEDYFGHNFELPMGSLGFSGWKKLTAVVPPTSDGEHGIVQKSPYFGEKPGLRVVGFRIDCDPMLSRGAYYLYLDDLRCVTDLYDIENRDEDDMSDAW